MLNQLLYHSDLFSTCVFIGGWFFVSSIISFIDGWYKVSEKYRREHGTSGKLFPLVNMHWGIWKYTRCVFVRVGEEGINISILLLFGFAHPPLLIAWEAFDSCTKTRFFSQWTQLTLKEPKYSICFEGDLADEIERCYHEFATK